MEIDPIRGADMALRALIVRCGVRVATHPDAPLWLRIDDVAEAVESKIERLRAALAAGPADLRWRGPMSGGEAAKNVEAAQEAAMKGGK